MNSKKIKYRVDVWIFRVFEWFDVCTSSEFENNFKVVKMLMAIFITRGTER